MVLASIHVQLFKSSLCIAFLFWSYSFGDVQVFVLFALHGVIKRFDEIRQRINRFSGWIACWGIYDVTLKIVVSVVQFD